MKHINLEKLRCLLMKLMVFLLVLPFFSNAQETKLGSLVNLTASNGFGNIFLGENIQNISKSKLAYMDDDATPDADGCVKYEYRDQDETTSNGKLGLELVGFRVYKQKIIDIYLFFKKESGFQFFQSFEANYGLFTQRTGDFAYSWETDQVKLCLKYDMQDLGLAVFSSKRLYQQIELDNSKQLSAQLIN